MRRRRDLTAEHVGHQLHAVADAQRRQPELEHPRVALRCVVFGDALRTTGEDDADRLLCADGLERRIERQDLGVHRQLTQPSSNQLRELRAEIENENRLVGHWRSCASNCPEESAGSDVDPRVNSSARGQRANVGREAAIISVCLLLPPLDIVWAIDLRSGSRRSFSSRRLSPRTRSSPHPRRPIPPNVSSRSMRAGRSRSPPRLQQRPATTSNWRMCHSRVASWSPSIFPTARSRGSCPSRRPRHRRRAMDSCLRPVTARSPRSNNAAARHSGRRPSTARSRADCTGIPAGCSRRPSPATCWPFMRKTAASCGGKRSDRHGSYRRRLRAIVYTWLSATAGSPHLPSTAGSRRGRRH